MKKYLIQKCILTQVFNSKEYTKRKSNLDIEYSRLVLNPNMSKAPKNKILLLDVGLPWLVLGIWNDYNQEWVYGNLQCDDCEGKEDTYFDNEYEKNPKGWALVPDFEYGGKK